MNRCRCTIYHETCMLICSQTTAQCSVQLASDYSVQSVQLASDCSMQSFHAVVLDVVLAAGGSSMRSFQLRGSGSPTMEDSVDGGLQSGTAIDPE
jgi:hypothetical protein